MSHTPLPPPFAARQSQVRIPPSLWIALAVIVAVAAVTFADWRELLKVALIAAGSGFGIWLAPRFGWRSNIATVCAGATAGFLTVGIFAFFAVLLPPPPQPGFVNWGAGSVTAATWMFFIAGALGAASGAVVGIGAASIRWLFRKRQDSQLTQTQTDQIDP